MNLPDSLEPNTSLQDCMGVRIKLFNVLTGSEVTKESVLENNILDYEKLVQFATKITDQQTELTPCVLVLDTTTGQQLQLSVLNGPDHETILDKMIVQEAFSCSLMAKSNNHLDSHLSNDKWLAQGDVLGSSSDKQVSFPDSAVTSKGQLALIKAIKPNLYFPEAGRFTDQFTQRSLSMAKVVEEVLLDFSTDFAEDHKTVGAIENGPVDTNSGQLAVMNLADPLSKLKVLIKDIQVYRTCVDNFTKIGTCKSFVDVNKTQQQLSVLLYQKWREIVEKAINQQQELQDAKNYFYLLIFLNEIKTTLAMINPVGCLPETASEKLQHFMEVYTKVEQNKPMVESCLQRVDDMGALKQCWDEVVNLANKKKVKLEKALEEATEFHDAFQSFVDWLTVAEKTLSGFKPAWSVMKTVLFQMEEDKLFQRDIEAQRQAMLDLDKKGTRLKNCKTRDVILIKNLLISVQQRWDSVLSRAKERARNFNVAKEYHKLGNWLGEAKKKLDDTVLQLDKDPERIKHLLAEHKDYQRNLRVKQETYDDVTRQLDELITNFASKTDGPVFIQMASDLKGKWQSVCNSSVVCQRKIEEELLLSGHFQDAIQVLVDWLREIDPVQMSQGPVDGDLDTIIVLRQQQKDFEEELNIRLDQTRRIHRMIMDSMADWNDEDKASILKQLSVLDTTWEKVIKAVKTRSVLLDDALCLQEIENVKNFSWDNWKQRFTNYMNWKKFNVNGLYKKMKKNNKGFISRDDFIEGITITKFPTSHMEMNVVVNMFDHNIEGYIDWIKFLNALQPQTGIDN